MKESQTRSECDQIAEYPGILKEQSVEVGFVDTVEIDRKEQNKVKKFITSCINTSCVLLQSFERPRKGNMGHERRVGSDERVTNGAEGR